ncbi:hypothetical protein OA251_00475 [Prochlorococcus sp. AH-716-P08]|nr:hypothetical protein [Prochlorococcus sp. AH-716-P08]
MFLNFKKIIHCFFFNSSLFLILIFAIQNSSTKKRVNFLTNQTVSLPISFIVGTSFISGSLTGSFISMIFMKEDIKKD